MPVESEMVPEGSPAPDFRLAAIDGREVALSGLAGRPVVLVFLRGFL
jgi:peroxiredoxin